MSRNEEFGHGTGHLPSGHRENWSPGERACFEYRCLESHDSGDAQAWYRSHQNVTVEGPDKGNEAWGSSWQGSTFHERGSEGMPRSYRVRWDDGFTHTAWEDELLVHPKHFTRPDPPKPRSKP